MAWGVDTCDLLDILEDNPAFGAFTLRHQGLVTRNVKDFAAHFPVLALQARG